MRWEQIVATGLSTISRIGRGLKPPRRGLRIHMYHAVGTTVPGDQKKLFNIQPELFKVHIESLNNNNNINLVRLSVPSNMYDTTDVAITFDDGYRDNLYVAAPILCALNIPFTVFVTTEYVGSNDKLYLNKNELKELNSLPGVTVGSHGKTHSRLTTCSNSVLLDELISSRHYLEDLLGCDVDTLSYPHGDVDKRVCDASTNAGYKLAVTSHHDINLPGQNPLLLNRVNVISSDTPYSLKMKTEGDWDWYRWRDEITLI